MLLIDIYIFKTHGDSKILKTQKIIMIKAFQLINS